MKKEKAPPKDFSRLPFEIYYSGPLSLTSFELMSDQFRVKKPADIKGLRIEQGRAYGVTFNCQRNTGAELYCCLTGSLEGAIPDWLEIVNVDDININHAEQHGVTIQSNGIDLCAPCDDDYLETFGPSLESYRLEEENPDYIILDPNGQRIKIDCEGYLIDDDGEVYENQRIIYLDLLSEDNSIGEAVSLSHNEAQDIWIKMVWKELFPKKDPISIIKYA